jgi:hypothetical protein
MINSGKYSMNYNIGHKPDNIYHKAEKTRKRIRYRVDFIPCIIEDWKENSKTGREDLIDFPMLELGYRNIGHGATQYRSYLGSAFDHVNDEIGFQINTGYYEIICYPRPKENRILWHKKRWK